MTVSALVDRNYSRSNGANPVSYQASVTNESEITLSRSIPDGTTDLELTFAVPYAQLKLIFMGADGDLTVEVNYPAGTSTAADQTFELVDSQPLVWAENDPLDNPITQDITTLYVTNASGAAVQFEARAVIDASP